MLEPAPSWGRTSFGSTVSEGACRSAGYLVGGEQQPEGDVYPLQPLNTATRAGGSCFGGCLSESASLSKQLSHSSSTELMLLRENGGVGDKLPPPVMPILYKIDI